MPTMDTEAKTRAAEGRDFKDKERYRHDHPVVR